MQHAQNMDSVTEKGFERMFYIVMSPFLLLAGLFVGLAWLLGKIPLPWEKKDDEIR